MKAIFLIFNKENSHFVIIVIYYLYYGIIWSGGYMHAVKVRNIIIGEGVPKLCVPIVAKDDKELLSALEKIVPKKPDIIEFRADIYESFRNKVQLMEALGTIRDNIGDIALLFTIRTAAEGGNASIEADEYVELCKYVCESGYADLIDVEAYMRDEVLEELCGTAHNNNVYVVASNHDFNRTPDETVIVERLKSMYERGADISKIAVMPSCEEDVIALLSATLKVNREPDLGPVITMSMGKMGMISRLTGEIFGSAVTFASVGEASAPGQIPIEDVRRIIGMFHDMN